jgi:hypothetical protein
MAKRKTKTPVELEPQVVQRRGCGRWGKYLLYGFIGLLVLSALRPNRSTTPEELAATIRSTPSTSTPRARNSNTPRASQVVAQLAEASDTPRSTATDRTADTDEPTNTTAATQTLASTNTSQPTNTARPTNTVTNTAPAVPPTNPPTSAPVSQASETYYVSGQANVRSCAARSCSALTAFPAGTEIQVLGTEAGESVSGSTTWYVIRLGSETGYVHSSWTSRNRVATQPAAPLSVPSVPTVGNSSVGNTSVPPPIVSTAGQQAWDCSGNFYNCSTEDFANMDEMYSYFNSCPGDPSGLDGNDNDGLPCESGLN